MDQEKLRALQSKYADSKGGDIFDPKFKRVAETVFSGGDNRRLPYADPPTLLDAPYRPQAVAENFTDLDVALIGVPFDLAVTNRPGARFGPRAVRTMERIGPYHHVHDMVPGKECRVADVGDVPFRQRFSIDACNQDIEEFYEKVAAAKVVPLSVGGDHSITYPIMKAIGRERPLGMVHIDAHCDTAGEYDGSKFHHGGPFRLAVLDGVLDPERTIQIGIRGSAEYLWEFSYESGMTVVHMEDFMAKGVPAVIELARKVVGDGPTYISLDVDGIDPAYTPGTGTPEVGGILPREAIQFLQGMLGLNIIGGDVVEVAPEYDATTNTAQVGGQMLFEILCLAAANLNKHSR